MNTTLERWNPVRELEDFQHRILSAFQPSANRRGSGGDGREPMNPADWMPAVDITEDEKEYVISADLPEIKREDIKVTMERGLLTLSGERKLERKEDNKKYHRVERLYGSFARSFTLPDDGDSSSVKADFKDGVLKIRIAKSEAAKPKQIEVKVS